MFKEHHISFAIFSPEMIIPQTMGVNTMNSEHVAEQNETLKNDICMVDMGDLEGSDTLKGTSRITMQQ